MTFDAEATREMAMLNLQTIATFAPLSMSAERAGINESVALTNLAILEYLDKISDCPPTCPYLDSLEDEEEFCECGVEEEDAAVEHLSNWVTDLLNDAYVPSLGTRIVFCTN